MKVLFIGNSHTFVHYVPARTAEFCKSYGQPIEPVMLTHPGMGLDWHLRQSQTYFNLLWGGYDAVILQHNAHPFPGKESLLEAGEQMAAITPPGFSWPDCSAASMMRSAMRSLEDPPGLKYSTLTAMVALTPAACGMWLSLTSGVLPMSSARLLWMVM